MKYNFLRSSLIIIVIFALFFSFFERSSTSVGLDNLAYITAIGIEAGDSDIYRISFQVSSIQSSSDSSSNTNSSNKSQEKNTNSKSSPFKVNTVECNSLDSGISLMNSLIDKSIDLSHCKVLVISEELASKGINSLIASIVNKIEIRPDCNIIISTIPKDEFTDSDMPDIQKLLPEYYSVTTSTENISGYTENVTVSDFFYALYCHCHEPVTALGTARSSKKSTVKPSNTSSSIDKTAQSITSDNNDDSPVIEMLGLAVFKDDILVGKLSGTETVLNLLLTNKLKTSTISIPTNISNTGTIDLEISLNRKPKIRIDTSSPSPFVDINLVIDAKILSINSITGNLTNELLEKVEYETTTYLTNQLYSYLNKTSKEYKSDINSFGRNGRKNFNTIQDWYNYDWPNAYSSSSFKVNVTTSVKSGYLLTNE